MRRSLTNLLAQGPVLAPSVFSPLSARLAADAGFPALYLGGGCLGFERCVLEANLNLHDVIGAGAEIMAACDLPLILDAAGGFGDPMHIRRTIRMAELTGFAAIEIEDQLLPKRAHHHAGIDHIVSRELLVSKINEAVKTRQDPDFLIIGRTNALGVEGMDEALRRGDAMREAGADLLFFMPRNPDEVERIGRTFGGGLMYAAPFGFDDAALGMPLAQMHALGYSLFAEAGLALFAAHEAMRNCYGDLANRNPDAAFRDRLGPEAQKVQATAGLNEALEIERRTLDL